MIIIWCVNFVLVKLIKVFFIYYLLYCCIVSSIRVNTDEHIIVMSDNNNNNNNNNKYFRWISWFLLGSSSSICAARELLRISGTVFSMDRMSFLQPDRLHWREHRALTLTSGLTSPFLYLHPDCWRKGRCSLCAFAQLHNQENSTVYS